MQRLKGAIAAGHTETAKAADLILRDGGNAFDAIIAAQFTAFVAEPVLTSLGGGGFLLAETAEGNQLVYDFFVQTPSKKREHSSLQFYPISADFGEVQQEYHIGPGSVAVPGMVKGLFEIHRDLCTLPMSRLSEPAIDLARRGVVMNSFQSGVFDIIGPIFNSSAEAKRMFQSAKNEDKLIREGEVLKRPDLADTIEQLTQTGVSFFYSGDIAGSIDQIFQDHGGHLSADDLRKYRVIKRKPLNFNYRGHEIAINPPPGSGGILIGFALKLMQSLGTKSEQFGSEKYLHMLVQVQNMTNKARVDAFIENPEEEMVQKLLDPKYLEIYEKVIIDRTSSFRGTTQISIADSDGNMASMTSSNGEGSGVMIPGTGIMLNNMLGEKDLNPGGFHRWQPDQRVTSMMAPGVLKMTNGTSVVFGSGGSNRIRTAILQVLLNLIDFEMSLEQAVSSPRIHFEEDQLNVEIGFDPDQLKKLTDHYSDFKIWKEKSLFFGGAHCVSSGPNGLTGAGDVRRGGVSLIVE